ncbi:helix-turn-helix domain-containing protein [Paenibacillus apiarius]|uniref:Transcriptional regulator n=1 Tax=Paenibacillus apiarius TaxID=46240 RepID=A0ABT4DR33_9BACL|nr:transcriptional regulator [Paenibacillus apiarius]MCY9517195.1 transcriptional regulator [Paenibacillus apiarius]MCY9519210.1 transcriptional regulator [Paenibacillus apiarius]MCY9555138.1 transcriptional regulator [Paenibacillus apiarius]MCY9559994.1 transcriptional regulator [Paenibacillus apiarius]MCY9683363.1 transcriptional regulator [Paenibacillus apiarius]
MESLQSLTFGDLIRNYRYEANLSLAQLGELAGLSKGTISKLENGEVKRPDFKTVHALAKVLQIPFDDIIEKYTMMENRSDVLISILHTSVESAPSLSVKVAIRFLHSVNKDSEELVEELYRTTKGIQNASIKLSLFTLIGNYARDHGMMHYVAKGLMQQYLIERDDFSKLRGTYQSGRSVLYFAGFLPKEEQALLYYKLGVHAFYLRLFQESMELCAKAVELKPANDRLLANSIGIICDANCELGNYDLANFYLQQYSKFSYQHVKENVQLLTATIYTAKGNTDDAISILQMLLYECQDQSLLHIVNELLYLYLKTENISEAEELLRHEEKITTIPYNTPYRQSELARFYQLKANYFSVIDEAEKTIDNFLISAEKYLNVNDIDKEHECIRSALNMIIRNNKTIHITTLKKIQSYYA